MADRPAYVPFFEETLRALAYLDAEDVKKYVVAITDYVYEDREPSMDGPAMSIFTMGRYQLDQKLGQRRTNRENARNRRKRGDEESEAIGERPVSETEANDERTVSETVANQERTESDGEAKVDNCEPAKVHILQAPISNLQDSNNPPLPLPPMEPVRVKSGDAPPFGEVPTEGQWAAYCEELCRKRGVEPDPDDFSRSYGSYEDRGWCHEDGTRYGNWHRLASTCVTNLGKWQEEDRKAGRFAPRRRRGNRGRASPAHQPSAAAIRADRDAEVIHSDERL